MFRFETNPEKLSHLALSASITFFQYFELKNLKKLFCDAMIMKQTLENVESGLSIPCF